MSKKKNKPGGNDQPDRPGYERAFFHILNPNNWDISPNTGHGTTIMPDGIERSQIVLLLESKLKMTSANGDYNLFNTIPDAGVIMPDGGLTLQVSEEIFTIIRKSGNTQKAFKTLFTEKFPEAKIPRHTTTFKLLNDQTKNLWNTIRHYAENPSPENLESIKQAMLENPNTVNLAAENQPISGHPKKFKKLGYRVEDVTALEFAQQVDQMNGNDKAQRAIMEGRVERGKLQAKQQTGKLSGKNLRYYKKLSTLEKAFWEKLQKIERLYNKGKKAAGLEQDIKKIVAETDIDVRNTGLREEGGRTPIEYAQYLEQIHDKSGALRAIIVGLDIRDGKKPRPAAWDKPQNVIKPKQEVPYQLTSLMGIISSYEDAESVSEVVLKNTRRLLIEAIIYMGVDPDMRVAGDWQDQSLNDIIATVRNGPNSAAGGDLKAAVKEAQIRKKQYEKNTQRLIGIMNGSEELSDPKEFNELVAFSDIQEVLNAAAENKNHAFALRIQRAIQTVFRDPGQSPSP